MADFRAWRFLTAALMALAFMTCASVPAEAAKAAAQPAKTADAPATPVSADTKAIRAKLDAFKADLDQKEAAIQGRELTDADLQRLRQGLEPVADSIRQVVDDLAPKLDSSKARLDQLGPKPKDGQPEESADVSKERAEREAAVAEIDETQRLGRALLVQAEQLKTQVIDLRRASFTRALFEQNEGLLSPSLWFDVAQAIPRELRLQRVILGDALDDLRRNATPGALLFLGLALGAAIAVHVGRRYVAHRFVSRDPAILEPSRRSRLVAAMAVLLLGAAPAIAGSWLVWRIFDSLDLVPSRHEAVIGSVLLGLAYVAFVRALSDAILAPGHSSWRLISLSDTAASRIMSYSIALAGVLVVGKALETFNKAMAAALPITVATRAVFATACALILAALLRRFATTASQDEACLGPYVAPDAEISGPVRIIGWVAVGAVLFSAVSGYVALASFLVDQLAWITVLLALLLLTIAFADEFIGNTLRTQTRIATTLQANTGLRRRSLEQIGVLANGAARVVLILIALSLALLPWGIESTDFTASVRAAFFGFKVGEVTISLSSIVIAALIFALGFAVTRVVQRWLDTTFLPATDLDAGIRNSIRTAFGYVGVITAGAVAFSYLGLSLDRIAIVAGALSVGIGFGLQSIVNNFVSGLILLWERPIRVGDLVVVGDGEGYVRRINVRATEIETFDRATVVVPNSNLISGVVRNRVRSDRTGRVIVTVPVPRASDADQVAEIMRNCALAHREVMSEPSPRVLFKKMTDSAIEFDLVCFVDEIETSGPVSSDLYFAIFRRLREEGIGTPAAAPATVRVQDLDKVQEQLNHIADMVEANRTAAATPAGSRSAGMSGDLPLQAIKAPARIIRKNKANEAQ
jgi:small-conductance mechanosensitive channel